VNIPAESGEMGILANHVPAIEQLKPGLVEIIEEAGASKQFFRTSHPSIGELEVESKDSPTTSQTRD
jgi:F0F1-type ATP synthase epsilon subunit